MRIIWKECKKILDVRLLLILFAFTILFYTMFMEITIYPSGGQHTDSPYDIPFAAELVKDLGPSLKIKDWSKIDDKIEELKNEYNTIIASNKILNEAGITTFDEMKNYWDKEDDEKELTKEEQKIEDEINRLIFSDETSSKLDFELQYAKLLNEFQGYTYGISKDQVTSFMKTYYEGTSKLYQKAISQRITKDYISLLPDGMLYILQSDMKSMSVLLLICFMVLIIPYQLKEKLRGVTPLYATTHTGRNIYKKQFLSSILSCGIVGILQLLVYLALYVWKGLAPFWACECWSAANNTYWCDNISFGAYMAIYMLLVLLFTLATVVVAYLIGRIAANYIAGIACSICIGGVIYIFMINLFAGLFYFNEKAIVAMWELPCIAIWLFATFILITLRLKKDKKTDIG